MLSCYHLITCLHLVNDNCVCHVNICPHFAACHQLFHTSNHWRTYKLSLWGETVRCQTSCSNMLKPLDLISHLLNWSMLIQRWPCSSAISVLMCLNPQFSYFCSLFILPDFHSMYNVLHYASQNYSHSHLAQNYSDLNEHCFPKNV